MITRRSLVAAPFVIAGAAALPPPALARAPLTGAATPPVYRFRLGAFEVTAVADGALDLDRNLFPAALQDPQTADRLVRQNGGQQTALRAFVNTYLVNTGDRLVLIDTGTGPVMGPGLGHLPRNLASAGIDPAAVDTVLLTHLHPDHVAGLAPGGAAAFPNAEVVVADAEYRFWTDEGIAARAPADAQGFTKIARDALNPYASRVRRVSQAGEVVPGITLDLAAGHTPGHATYRIASGADQLLVWGDAVHAAAFQFERPDWSVAFDTDPSQAAQTRRRLFDLVAADRLLVAGMHLPFPGIGTVARQGDAYAYTPQLWPTN